MKKDRYQALLADLRRRKLPAVIKRSVEVLLDKKAEKIMLLKLKDVVEITDWLIVCQANSSRQAKALADHLRETLKRELRQLPLGVEGEERGEWVLLDYVDYVVNIFLPETREKYSLEKLWMDAKRYDFSVD